MVESKPGKRVSYIRSTLNNAREHGAPIAVHRALEEANVTVAFDKNETKAWGNHKNGILFIGDHKKGLEPILLCAALGELGRRNIHFVAMPYVFPEKIAKRFGLEKLKIVLPIIPKYAVRRSNNKNSESRHKPKLSKLIARVGTYVVYGKLSEEDRVEINDKSKKEASELLTQGDDLGIFPTGKKDINSTWYEGAADILLKMSADERQNVLVEPFSCDDGFSRRELSKAVIRRTFGSKPKEKRTFNIKFASQPKTVDQLIGAETNPKVITDKLKDYYLYSMGMR